MPEAGSRKDFDWQLLSASWVPLEDVPELLHLRYDQAVTDRYEDCSQDQALQRGVVQNEDSIPAESGQVHATQAKTVQQPPGHIAIARSSKVAGRNAMMKIYVLHGGAPRAPC